MREIAPAAVVDGLGTMLALLALLATPTLSSAEAQACVLEGTASVDPVTIAPPGAPPFDLQLEEHPLRVELGPRTARVVSTSALAFEGTAAAGAIPVALARVTRVGPLEIDPGVTVERTRLPADGGSPTLDLRLDREVTARGVPVGCEALRLGRSADPREPPRDSPSHLDLGVRVLRLRVTSAPGSGVAVTLALESTSSLSLTEVERRGAFVRVRRDFQDGARLDGWVRSSHVRTVPREEVAMFGTGFGFGGLGLCGVGAGSHRYRGPATLRAGAEVRVSAGGPTWATVRRDLPVRQIDWLDGAAWAQVTRFEGVRGHGPCADVLETAWVPAAAVILPDRRP